jgi:hypothetical protein
MHITTVRTGKKLNVLDTIKINMPSPFTTYKYRKEDKERTKRARRDARLVKILTQ